MNAYKRDNYYYFLCVLFLFDQAGNVVTGEMVEQLILNGADIIKVGIGPGESLYKHLFCT